MKNHKQEIKKLKQAHKEEIIGLVIAAQDARNDAIDETVEECKEFYHDKITELYTKIAQLNRLNSDFKTELERARNGSIIFAIVGITSMIASVLLLITIN